MSRVPLLDLGPQNEPLRADLIAAVARVVDRGDFIMGADVAAFEKQLAEVLGVKHTIGVSSGTDALLVGLMALGVGRDDEVVTSPFSFFATAGTIRRLAARPVFADIEADSFNLDPAAALAACGAKTRAIIPVHLFGRPATLPAASVPVLEDAAQSIGAVPLRGVAGCLSFFPSKNLGAFGDAGAVYADDDVFADRARLLRTHGSRPKYVHHVVGGNFRLDTVQAAVLKVKLPHLASWTQARRANAERYRRLFAASKVPAEVRLPADAPGHIYNQFVIRAPRRDALREHLSASGVETVVYYPIPFHLQPCFADLGYQAGAFPVAERACQEVVALPIFPGLTEAQQEHVVDRIAAFYA
jgi:dTDP-4-amino-4,6-dideoxygalactose transaminase